MTDLERQLRATFAAYHEQVEAPPFRRPRSAPRRRIGPVLAAAAATVSLVLAAVTVRDGRQPDVDVAAEGTPPAVFDAAVEAVCRDLDLGRNGLAPRFDTAEAYAVVATARRQLVEDADTELLALPAVDDTRRRAAWAAAVAALRAASVELVGTEAMARAGDLAGARVSLDTADSMVQEATAGLAAFGIRRCDAARSTWGDR